MDIYSSVIDNKNKLEADFLDCSDFLLRECKVNGTDCIVCVLDGMVDSLQLSHMIMNPILNYSGDEKTNAELFETLKLSVVNSLELSEVTTFEDVHFFLSSGFAVVFIDGVSKCLSLGIQGFSRRQTDEPPTEAAVKGAKECFTETLNDNKAIIRRRIKTPNLKLKQLKIGEETKTSVIIAYISGVADETLISDVEKRITEAPIKNLQDFGELSSFLDSEINSYFSAVGNTERPDTLCSKLLEGRVAVMMDGSPFAVYVPYLFTDSFSTVDDYDDLPFYATLNRLLKYFAFIMSIALPGFYVATGTFHQELIPTRSEERRVGKEC